MIFSHFISIVFLYIKLENVYTYLFVKELLMEDIESKELFKIIGANIKYYRKVYNLKSRKNDTREFS